MGTTMAIAAIQPKRYSSLSRQAVQGYFMELHAYERITIRVSIIHACLSHR